MEPRLNSRLHSQFLTLTIFTYLLPLAPTSSNPSPPSTTSPFSSSPLSWPSVAPSPSSHQQPLRLTSPPSASPQPLSFCFPNFEFLDNDLIILSDSARRHLTFVLIYHQSKVVLMCSLVAPDLAVPVPNGPAH
ncbi:hypothetical protein Tsubulata_024436 [Turnera subulata]|uniref:Uncharacterized protein n=1 Tax=Turnera subulata TaxID=218843 RepID=A0A9Q0FN12_9ROSI|nr:hypothetical protein Tsubulata_024436 [Turnera subulata]